MAFHFKRKESLDKAARRLCCERIGKTRDCLGDCSRLEAIHRARKEIKKARAVLRLVHAKTHGAVCRKCSGDLRMAAKRLRDPRDAHVRLRTLERLIVRFKGRLPPHPFAGIRRVLRQHCDRETREFIEGESARAVNQVLRKAERRAKDLKVKSDGWAVIRAGLRESYSRGRKASVAARKSRSPENFHQWRKRVQDLWHQLRLLRSIQPVILRPAINKLKLLSQHLGDDHDLVMLGRFVSRTCRSRHLADVKRLNELIELRQKELRSAALAIGSRFYTEAPSLFCQRLKTSWLAWRSGKTSRK